MAMSGQTAVTSAGTAVRLAANQVCVDAVLVKAITANTGIMYVGDDGNSDVSSTTGYPLAAGDQVILDVRNLNQVWVDASQNGEKVAWILVKA